MLRSVESEQKTIAGGSRKGGGGHKNHHLLPKAKKDKGRKKQRETRCKVGLKAQLQRQSQGSVKMVEQMRGSGVQGWGANAAPMGKGSQRGGWAGASTRAVISKQRGAGKNQPWTVFRDNY